MLHINDMSMIFRSISIWCVLHIMLISSSFLEYEYISETEMDLSDTSLTGEHVYENNRTRANTSTRTRSTTKQHETAESICSLDAEIKYLHQGICQDDVYAANSVRNMISLTPASRRQSTEVRDVQGDAPLGDCSGKMHMAAPKPVKCAELDDVKGFLKNRKPMLKSTAENLLSGYDDTDQDLSDVDNTKQDVSQDENEHVSQLVCGKHAKKQRKSNEKPPHHTDYNFPHLKSKSQQKIAVHLMAHGHKQEVKSVVEDVLHYLGQEEQTSYAKLGPTLETYNVLPKHISSDSDADGQSKRNSYEKLNSDTMEPQDKICQCKAHPRRTKSKTYGRNWEAQQKNLPATSCKTPPVHPYMEAVCQRTAGIMLKQLSRRTQSCEKEMDNMFKIGRHVDAKHGLRLQIVESNENVICGEKTFGSIGQGDLQSNEEMRNISRYKVPYEMSGHQTRCSDFCETSFADIPFRGQGHFNQVTNEGHEQDVKEYFFNWGESSELSDDEDVFNWGEPSEMSDDEENSNMKYDPQQSSVEKKSSEKLGSKDCNPSMRHLEHNMKIKRD